MNRSPYKQALNNVCRDRRDERRITIQAISDETGIPTSTLSKFFSGETHSTSVDLAGAVCKVLDVSLDDFFGILPRDSDLVGPEVHRLRAQVELYERAARKKDRWIRALAIALGAVLLGIIAVLAIDLLRHDVGWFQDMAARWPFIKQMRG